MRRVGDGMLQRTIGPGTGQLSIPRFRLKRFRLVRGTIRWPAGQTYVTVAWGSRTNAPMARWGMMMKKVWIPGTTQIQFTFEGCEPLTFDAAKADPFNRARAEMHGWLQRLGDAAAIEKSAENGYKVTDAMRRQAIEPLIAHYQSGNPEWSMRTSGRAPVRVLNPLVVQLAERLEITYDEAERMWNEAALATLAALTGGAPQT